MGIARGHRHEGLCRQIHSVVAEVVASGVVRSTDRRSFLKTAVAFGSRPSIQLFELGTNAWKFDFTGIRRNGSVVVVVDPKSVA